MAQQFAKAFYKSKQWRLARKYALKRDSYRCQECGAAAEEVHHIIWLTKDNISDPNISVNPENLMCLCYQCHKAKHFHSCNTKNIIPDYGFDPDGGLIPPVGAQN